MDGPPELDDLPDDLRARLKGELAPGERLLWAGRPLPKPVRLTNGYLVAALFALGCGATCIALVMTHQRPPDRFGRPDEGGWMAGAMATGILALLTPWLMLAHWHSKLATARGDARRLYALTNRRAIVWQPVPGSEAVEVTSYDPRHIKNLHRVENPEGTGSVKFAGTGPWGTGFDNIADVRRVEDLVRMNLGNGVGRRGDDPGDIEF